MCSRLLLRMQRTLGRPGSLRHAGATFPAVRGFSSQSQRMVKERPPITHEEHNQVFQDELMDSTLIGLTGGQIFHELMRRHGVKTIFGYPGGAILPVFDAIYNSSYFDFILTRHEQGAGHMAQGWARATGKPGVVLVTSGPGATNVVTPMQDALSDGTPLVVFSGQVPTTAIGTDAFQEADVIGISRSCTKWNVMVKDLTELPRRINEAFYIATSGRPGPVLIDLPKDVTAGVLDRPPHSAPYVPSHRKKNIKLLERNREELLRSANLINKARAPIIFAGQGVITAGASDVLRELALKGNIPVTTTLQGLGCFDEESPLSLHMLGMHGSAYANFAIQEADVIIAIGARFDDRVTGNLQKFAMGAKKAAAEGRGGIIHFEILPKNINKVVTAQHVIEGDCLENLRYLLPMIRPVDRHNWLKKIMEWKQNYPFAHDNDPEVLSPQEVLQELDHLTADVKDRLIITTGVGQHQMWAAQYIRWRHPNTFITSGGLGTMGFGLPSAIGAKAARPDSIVIDIDGDASFSMTGMELITAAQYNIGVKVLVLNNDFQGMVKQWQDLFYEKRYSGTVMHNPDFVKFAEACNCKGMRVSSRAKLREALQAFLDYDGPVLMEAVVCKEQHVYPMVPAGKALDEMVLHTPKK